VANSAHVFCAHAATLLVEEVQSSCQREHSDRVAFLGDAAAFFLQFATTLPVSIATCTAASACGLPMSIFLYTLLSGMRGIVHFQFGRTLQLAALNAPLPYLSGIAMPAQMA
jgi:hypothetical protein